MKYTIEFDDRVNLKKELQERGLTLRKFSQITGIHFATLSTIANGGRCSEERAKKIKDFLSTLSKEE